MYWVSWHSSSFCCVCLQRCVFRGFYLDYLCSGEQWVSVCVDLCDFTQFLAHLTDPQIW
jgi:hypothetical protein